MAHVGVACFFNGVVIHINNTVEVARCVIGDVVEELVVEHAVGHVDEFGKSDGGEVAHRNFVFGRVFHDLRAEVGRTDGAEVLLVGLLVGRIFVEHVRRAGFDLGFDNLVPYHTSWNGLTSKPAAFVILVHGLELRTVDVLQSWALVRAEEGPVAVVFNTLHEQVGRPHGVEQVASAHLFLAVVLLQVEELKDVRVPRLEIDRN